MAFKAFYSRNIKDFLVHYKFLNQKSHEFGITLLGVQGTLGGVMVCKLDEQTFTSEFKSHWVSHLFGLVPHLSKLLFEGVKAFLV